MMGIPSEKCVHCGKCLAVCPSYRFFLKESFSPRGRNLLILKKKDAKSLDYCLLCERCSRVCPQGISFPEAYLKEKLQNSKLKVPPPDDSLNFLNFLTLNQIFRKEFKERDLSAFQRGGDFYIYLSCGLKHLYPRALDIVLERLRENLLRPHIPENQGCCGIVFLGLGIKETVKEYALKLLRLFPEKKPLLTFCATCLWMIKKVYPLLFDREETKVAFNELANRTYFVLDFLEKTHCTMNLNNDYDILYHKPCHLSLALTSEKELLNKGIVVEDFCCGSAKPYLWLKGFQEKFSRFWKRGIMDRAIIATACTGCYLNFSFILGNSLVIRHWIELVE
ncbi:MAG: (Fe-S)-binding protein [Caldimicrobium sp.]|nr:(Fe-S)-binding protein [Caldimicrobium sp.]